MPYLHLGYAFVHEILSSKVEGVGEMIDLLVRQKRMVRFHLDNGRGPIQSPVLIGMCPFESILIQYLFDEFHCPVLKLVEVANLVVLGHVAHL